MIAHDFGYWLQQLFNAVTLASFYIPLAVAYALVQGISNKIFLSFGDFAMFAAFAAIYGALAGQVAGYETILVLLMSIGLAAACSSALGRFAGEQVFAPLINRPSHAFMIGSVGVSIALQELMRLQSGSRDLWLAPFYDGAALKVYDGSFAVQLGYIHMLGIVLSFSAVCGVVYMMKYTALGRYWRACAQSETLARLCGVDTGRVLLWSCVGSAALASISGWIIAVVYGGVTFSMGLMLGFKAMFASVVGGFGTLQGAIAGGIFLAFIETFWAASFPVDYRDVGVFGLIILILIVKPEGLSGTLTKRESEN
jgi:branched-chain amino acid transport system permease protein